MTNNMQAEKQKGCHFWDFNPVGGGWSSYKEKVEWVLNTESYVYDVLTEDLLKGKRVLDVGCGPGLGMSLAAEYCSTVVGLDYSEASLREAKSGFEELKLNNANLLCRDAEDLPFAADLFDVVYCIGVLHHTPDTSKAIGEAVRVLNPGGRVAIMIYKAYSPRWLAVKSIRGLSRMVDRLKGEDFYIASRLRTKYQRGQNSRHGTALLELFGCPTLKMYSRRQSRNLFSRFKDVKLQCYQPGFSRLLDFLPPFSGQSILHRFFTWFDRVTANTLGFYLVIRAEK